MDNLRVTFAVFLIAGASMVLPGHVIADVDSFFDVWYEVTFDDISESPVVKPVAYIRDIKNGSRAVQTEMLSMSLTSRKSGDKSSTHIATLKYRVRNIGSSGEDSGGLTQRNSAKAYAELEIVCIGGKCVIEGAKPISRADFRGHVTVLK